MEIFATWFCPKAHLSLAEQAASGVGCGKFLAVYISVCNSAQVRCCADFGLSVTMTSQGSSSTGCTDTVPYDDNCSVNAFQGRELWVMMSAPINHRNSVSECCV